MIHLTLVAEDDRCRQPDTATAPPVFYMEDYSVLALSVDRFDRAMGLLDENGFMAGGAPAAVVAIETHQDLLGVVELLAGHGIAATISDVADGFYQG